MKRLSNAAWWTLTIVTWCLLSATMIPSFVRGDEPTAEKWEPSDESVLIYEEAMRHRANNNLPRQTHDVGLASIAQRVANYQAYRGAMGHTSLGDNVVAYGMPPRGMVSMWIGSSGHRPFILGGASHCGYGFARASNGNTYAAGIFRNAACAVCDPTDMSGIGGTSGGRSRRGWFRRR